MEGIFLKIVNMSITAGWLIIAAVIIRAVLKNAPKSFRFILWALVAVRLVCPFSFESILSLVPSSEPINTDIMYSEIPEIDSGIAAVDNVINNVIADKFSPGDSESVNPMQVIVFAGAFIWICGMVIMLLYALISYLRLRKKTAVFLWIDKNVRICDDISSPFILGVFKPVIYVPSFLNTTQLEYILAHERAHIKRRDYIWKPLGFILLTVYWFNPLIWLSYILLCRDIELACDEHVIKDMNITGRKEYSGVLLDCSIKRRTIMLCPLAFGEVGIKERIKSVLNYKKPAFWLIIICVVLCVGVSLCLFTSPKNNISDELDKAVSEVILSENDNYVDNNTDKFGCEDHQILAVKNHGSQVTVYMMVLAETYRLDNDGISVDSGIHAPMAATFNKTDNDEYALVEFWYPKDGSEYAKSIRKKFPITTWRLALNTQKYVDKQEKNCRKQAEEYFKDKLSAKNVPYVNNDDNTLNTPDETTPANNGLMIGKTDFDFNDVKEFLSGFPNNMKKLVKKGCFVTAHGQLVGGLDVWNRFYANVKAHIPCDMISVQFTVEGDAILDYVYYNGKTFYCVNDSSRDAYGGSADSGYTEYNYSYMNVYDEVLKNGDKTLLIVLSEDEDMTYDEYCKVIESETYDPDKIRCINISDGR